MDDLQKNCSELGAAPSDTCEELSAIATIAVLSTSEMHTVSGGIAVVADHIFSIKVEDDKASTSKTDKVDQTDRNDFFLTDFFSDSDGVGFGGVGSKPPDK